MTMSVPEGNRSFADGRDVTDRVVPPGWHVYPQDVPVVVTLPDGSVHTHQTASFRQTDDQGETTEQWQRVSSYEVLASGALAIVSRAEWSVGRVPAEGDSPAVVRVYAPQAWDQVSGTMEDDRHRAQASAARGAYRARSRAQGEPGSPTSEPSSI